MTAPNKHSELEVKFGANYVFLNDFERAVKAAPGTVVEFKKVVGGHDWYYNNAQGNVVRHRVGKNCEKNELTVKARKSAESITNRVEIDLGFDEATKPVDVTTFLYTAGWSLEFFLVKDSYIYTVECRDFKYTAVVYDVGYNKSPEALSRRFFEVEIEKDHALSEEIARRIEAELQYPGQIKVVLIRETRAVDFAR